MPITHLVKKGTVTRPVKRKAADDEEAAMALQLPKKDDAFQSVAVPRGVSFEAWDGAFFPYTQVKDDESAEAFTEAWGAANPTIHEWALTLAESIPDGEPAEEAWMLFYGAVQRLLGAMVRDFKLATRAPGVFMQRFPVPEAYPVPEGEDPFLLAEMRPAWKIALNLDRRSPKCSITPHRHGIEPEWYEGMPENERRWLEQGFPGPRREREYTRRKHVNKRKNITPVDVFNGVTMREYDNFTQLPGFEVTYGGTHNGVDTDELHVHVEVVKYTFPATPVVKVPTLGTPHAHTDYDDAERYGPDGVIEYLHAMGKNHVAWKAGGDRFTSILSEVKAFKYPMRSVGLNDEETIIKRDEEHEHEEEQADERKHPAKRLSWHPYEREERWQRDRVCFAMEGCLKEAALVTAGEATVSCPSITLWDAQELRAFAQEHLTEKQVLVICDSDWQPGVGERPEDDDGVLKQVLLLRDRLRLYLGHDDVHACAPGHPRNPETGEQFCNNPKHDKHGVDDFLGPCTNGEVNDLVTIVREVPGAWWEDAFIRRYAEHPQDDGRRRKLPVMVKDQIVLRYLATLAAANGDTRVSLWAVAKNLQEALGSPTQDAAFTFVKESYKRLVEISCLEVIEPLNKRKRGRKFRADFNEWSGVLRVLEPFRTETYLGTVRDL